MFNYYPSEHQKKIILTNSYSWSANEKFQRTQQGMLKNLLF